MKATGAQNVQKVCFCALLPFLVSGYVSLYLLHQYSGEQSHVWKRKKRKSFEFWGPRGGEQNPEVRSKLALRALPLAAYLVNISTSFLLSKHVNWCRCTLDWPGQAGIEILFVLYFFSCLSSEPLHITCLALMMLLIKCSRSVGGFAWQAWCLSFSEISPPLALSTSHSPTQQHCALDAQPVNSSLANYHLWLPYKTGLDPHHCCKHRLLFHGSLSLCCFVPFYHLPLHLYLLATILSVSLYILFISPE